MRAALVGATALACVAAWTPAAAQRKTEANAFHWREAMSAGSWLRVRNLNGNIHVESTAGNVAEVSATKTWRRGDPKDVRIEVYKGSGGSVMICALWEGDSTCDEHGYHSSRDGHGRDDSDVAVEFTVRLPSAVKVDVQSMNGDLRVDGAGSEVVARTVNGGVDATAAAGPVNATTVNGGVRVRLAALAGTDDLHYSTVNGSVSVELPASASADVEMSTVNGSLSSDFPLTVSGRFNPRSLRATIGSGGRRLVVKTVNGAVELRKVR